MAKARLVISNANGRSIGLPVGRLDADGIQALAERSAPKLAKRWGTPVTVDFFPGDESAENDQSEIITFNLGNLPTTQEG